MSNSVSRFSRAQSGEGSDFYAVDTARAPWPYLPVAAIFAVCWASFAWPWLSGSVTIPWDAKAQFAPQVQFLAASIGRGESPFWTPHNFAGHPQIADPQSLIFSPPFLIVSLITAAPSMWAIDTTVLVMVLVAGLGVLWWARDQGWHWAGAVVAALGFCFGASMAWRLQHFGQVLSLAYLPFALLFLNRALARSTAVDGLAAGMFGAFIILGRDQVGLLCVYILIASVIWHLATAEDRGGALRAAAKPLAAGAISGLVLAAVPLLLTLLLAGQSNRPTIDYPGAAAGSLHPALVITSVIPQLFGAAGEMAKFWGPPSFTWLNTGLFTAQNMGQLYIGALPLLVLIAGTVRGLLWDREVRFLTLALMFVTLYALGGFTPLFRLFYELLPGVKMFRRPADATFLMGGLASLLAGYVAHRLFTWTMPEAKPWQRVAEIGLIGFAFTFAIGAAVALDRVGQAVPPMLMAAAWLTTAAALLAWTEIRKTLQPIGAGLVLIAFTTADIAWNNGPNGASAIDPSAVEILQPDTRNQTLAFVRHQLAQAASPDRRDRVELIGLGFHWPNASLSHSLEQTLGYNPVRLRLYAEATGAGDSSGGADQRKFSPLMPGYRSTLADMLGLRYIVSGVPIEKIDPTIRSGDFQLLAGTPDGYVYENPRAHPRVILATRAEVADFDKLLSQGGLPDRDYLNTVLLGTRVPERDRRPGTAKIKRYTNTAIEIEADAPDGGWVVLNDPWHPWWAATIDGAPAPLLRANVLFRAVAVPAGRSLITLTFQPLRGAFREFRGR